MGKRHCCIDSCPNRKERESSISLFLPPKDIELFRKWMNAVRPYKISPLTPNSVICELHFNPNSVLREYVTKLKNGTIHKLPRDRVSLVLGAVPTRFEGLKKSQYIEMEAPSKSDNAVTYIFEVGKSDEEEETVSEENWTGLGEMNAIEDDQMCDVVESEDENASIEDTYSLPPDTESDDEVEYKYRVTADSKTHLVIEQRSVPKTDVRLILGNNDNNSIINDKEAFSRFCRDHTISNVCKRGRRSIFRDDTTQNVEKKARISADERVSILPTKILDVLTLVSNIDCVKFPSDNWFCTMKDGGPTFMCWSEGFRIRKKVIFDTKNLNPIIMIDDIKIHISEVIRPRSFKEVNSILTLVDSVERCQEKDGPSRIIDPCSGYFFPDKDTPKDSRLICPICRPVADLYRIPIQLNFEVATSNAEYILTDFPNWSHSVLGTCLMFLGWRKCYELEKMYILDNELSIKILFGDKFVTIDGVESPKTLDDIISAIEILDLCRKCCGIDNAGRADNCDGFIPHANQRVRVARCEPCSEAKRKKTKQTKQSKLRGHLVRCSERLPSLRMNQLAGEQNLISQDDKRSMLFDALDHIKLPSDSWSFTIVDNAIVFNKWGAQFSIMKKLVIHSDLSIKIFIMDDLVEINGIGSVETVDEVSKLLTIVDSIRLCDGYGNYNSKSSKCLGIFHDPEVKKPKVTWCCECAKEYRLVQKKKLAKKFANRSRDTMDSYEIDQHSDES